MNYIGYVHDNTLYKVTCGIAKSEEAKKSLKYYQNNSPKTLFFIIYE